MATETVNVVVDVFNNTDDGFAPASGGGTTNFLRADGTWAVPPGSGIFTIPTGNTLWVDAVNGNDGTAVVERQDKPYLTLSAAKTAASSGDLILVRPGSYTVSASLAKNGVNWYLEQGVAITATDMYLTGIFGDDGTDMSYSVGGYGQILAGVSLAADEVYAVSVTGANSEIDITAERIRTTNEGSSSFAFIQSAGQLRLNVTELSSNAGTIGQKTGGIFRGTIGTLLNFGGAGGFGINFDGGGPDDVEIGFWEGLDTAIYNAGSNPCSVTARIGGTASTCNGPLFYINDGTLSGSVLSANGILTSSGANASCVINAQDVVNNTVNPTMGTDGGNMYVHAIRMRGSAPFLSCTVGGDITIDCDDAESTFAGAGMVIAGPVDLKLRGNFRLTTNNPMVSTASSGWHAGATIHLDAVSIEVGSGATESFFANAARTISGSAADINKPLSSNITATGDLFYDQGGPNEDDVATANPDGTWSWAAPTTGIADGATLAVGLTFPNGGLKVQDSTDANTLALVPGENLSANRTLTLNVGDGDRSLTIGGSTTLNGGTHSGTNTGDETAQRIGDLINGATSKATPVDADQLGLMDSAAGNILKKLSWANVKATLKTYLDTLYQPLAATLTSLAATTFSNPGSQSLAASVTFTAGLAPATPNNTYNWIRVGNKVDYQFTLAYGVAGTTVSNIVIAFPGDMPNPVEVSGLTGASASLYTAITRAANTASGGLTAGNTTMLRRNAADNAYEFNSPIASGTYTHFWISGSYFTA